MRVNEELGGCKGCELTLLGPFPVSLERIRFRLSIEDLEAYNMKGIGTEVSEHRKTRGNNV